MAETFQGPRIEISFSGGKRVTASFLEHQVHSDQPQTAGGDGSAPSPFDLFFASLATCAGFYVLEFCSRREIPTTGIRISQTYHREVESRRVTAIHLEIHVPPDFPAKYRTAVVHAASSCTVKKLVENPPAMDVQVVVAT